jgi:hypothetical protein
MSYSWPAPPEPKTRRSTVTYEFDEDTTTAEQPEDDTDA